MSSLASIHSLTGTASAIILDHVDSLIKILLTLTKFPSMEVRERAVITLELFTSFPYPKIHPSKDNVICQLLPVLDDKKRIVRRAASRCRNEW